MSLEKVRVDRWLWAVRAYKTRSLATDACKRNWVSVNGTKIKPSREIRAKDIITFKKNERDTRIKHFFLNDKGKKIFNEIFEIQKKRIYNALLNSSSQEVLNFDEVLKRIING